MLVYNIGISAVQANQAALQTISNNIANASTEGYHRQRVNLAQNSPIVQNNLQFGTGVNVSSIQRMVNSAADSALTLNLSQSAESQVKLETARAIEGLLTPASGSLTDAVGTFFSNVEKLASSPTDGTLRREVVSAAQMVAQQITTLNSSLDQLQRQQATSIQETVNQVNQLTGQISALNQQIKLAQVSGVEPNTLMDQRDQLVQNLGKLVDISPGSFTSSDGTMVAAGGWLVISEHSQPLSVIQGDNGTLQIQIGSRGPVVPASGQLAGLLASHNEMIPETRDALQTWSSAFISGVNSVQATGLNLSGPDSLISGFNSISNPNVPLAQANTVLPMQSGTLYISVTNAATGERKTHEISIDPAQDSLQDVMARMETLPHVSAGLSTAGQVRLMADTGFLIDFAGRPDSVIDTSSIAGSAIPRLSGTYQGDQGGNWTFTADSTGQVGATDGLKVRVTNSSTGELITVLNVGTGYMANQPIEVAGGLSVQFNAGTLQAGDTFQADAVADPDSSGFLNAMGMGGLFQTADFRSVAVNSSIVKDPGLLAASRTGNAVDASQLNRIVQFRTAPVLSAGTESIEARLANLTSNTGSTVNFYQAQSDHFQSQYDQIRNQQDAVSGVDPNEELMAMLQFQRAFQANARFIATINDSLDDLLGIIR